MQEYIRFINKVDQLTEKLVEMYKDQINCKKGCASCCVNFNIFPVEFYFIRQQITKTNAVTSSVDSQSDSCKFLNGNSCSIYQFRPLICRTHGLPLLYMDELGENWEFSACDLNFKDVDLTSFTLENTFPQDRYNSELFMLNKNFLKNTKDLKYSEFDLLSLNEI